MLSRTQLERSPRGFGGNRDGGLRRSDTETPVWSNKKEEDDEEEESKQTGRTSVRPVCLEWDIVFRLIQIRILRLRRRRTWPAGRRSTAAATLAIFIATTSASASASITT